MIGDLPRFGLRTVAVGWRVENHRVVAFAALQFPLAELACVLGDPADWMIGEVRQFSVAAGALDNVPCRVNVYYFGTRRRGSQRAGACVGEQVEHAQGAAA